MSDNEYEIIIIGGGPAGLTAGIYASRARRNTLLIEKEIMGGQIANTELVENFPGFPDGINGYELGPKMGEQAMKFGLKMQFGEVTGVELRGNLKIVKTTDGEFSARALIIASGMERSKLGVPGEEKFAGKGVSYCATCDGALFRDVPVAIAGGGDSAITEALHLARFASRVYLIHRRDQLRATKILQEKAFAEPKMQFVWNSVVEEIEGEEMVKRLRLRNVKTGEKTHLEVFGIFVSIGFKPRTELFKGIVPMNEGGHIITNEKLETAVPGVFVAGDVRQNSAWQAITAAGDGATAAIFAERWLG
ncbi:MAG: thioredoxin-disulfide reductase [Chloroflexi bacterium]|nr:thioredoxin-disulfide reductase [Chloroflexota bacterium]